MKAFSYLIFCRPTLSFDNLKNYIYIYIYMCVCVCVCMCACVCACVHQ